jgi:hypothetical protein
VAQRQFGNAHTGFFGYSGYGASARSTSSDASV